MDIRLQQVLEAGTRQAYTPLPRGECLSGRTSEQAGVRSIFVDQYSMSRGRIKEARQCVKYAEWITLDVSNVITVDFQDTTSFF